MSQAGRHECQTFPARPLTTTTEGAKPPSQSKIAPNLIPRTMRAAAIMILTRQRASKRQFQAQGLRPHGL
jgi:hypothetical protein